VLARRSLLEARQIWLPADEWWNVDPRIDFDTLGESEDWDEEEDEVADDQGLDDDEEDDDGEAFDLNPENFARSHLEGWYYSDSGPD
jgi:hypothetical protein